MNNQYQEKSCCEVYPESTEEVKAMLQFANSEKRTVSWKACSRIFPPHNTCPDGSMIINVSSMKKIEVDEPSRYAVVEPGVTHEELSSYLEANHPGLRHCLLADSSEESVTATAITCGKNSLATLYGSTSDMIQGLEVVLPDGTVTTLGTGSVSPSWFASGPLPELRGIFLNWDGTMGIITKLSLRLFCVPKLRDLVIYTLREPELLPEVIEKITQPEMVDQICIIGKESPAYMKGLVIISLQLSGNSQEELLYKKEVFKNLFNHNKKIMYKENLPETMREAILAKPVDIKNALAIGCGFVSFFMSPETIPEAWDKAKEIIHKHSGEYSFDFAVIDHGHHILGTVAFLLPDNENDGPEKGKAVGHELETEIINLGGIIKGVTPESYRRTLQRMEPCTRKLLNRFRSLVDPNGIMNHL